MGGGVVKGGGVKASKKKVGGNDRGVHERWQVRERDERVREDT